MDFVKDDELDYEEDDLLNDSLNNHLDNETNIRDEIDKNSNLSELDDQYLRIDCSEDEENFIEQAHINDVNSKSQNGEVSEKSEPPKPPPSLNKQANNFSKNDVAVDRKPKKNFKKTERSSKCRAEVKSDRNPFVLFQRFPTWNLSLVNSPSLGGSLYNQQMLNLQQQDFYFNPRHPIPLLGLNPHQWQFNRRFKQPQAFNSVSSTGIRFSLVQQNKSFANQPGPSVNKNRSNFPFEYERRTFSGNGTLEMSSSEQLNIRGQNDADNFQITEGKKNFQRETLQSQNVGENSDGNFSENGVKYDGGKSKNNFSVKCNLEVRERELIQLKKEARLKRFMNDKTDEKEKKLNNSTSYKIEEQKLTREKSLRLAEQNEKKKNLDVKANLGKPDINIEVLLKKKNPFGADLETSNCAIKTTIKQEKGQFNEVKEEISGSKLVFPVKKEGEKIVKTEDSSHKSAVMVKNEGGSSVKFVRTVSKSFDELASKKPKPGIQESKDELSLVNKPVFVPGNVVTTSNNDLATQVVSQLTGCIVKVLNIPPTTTIDDILTLCSPIGIVKEIKEIKINLPKENSVAIRFAEPSCAENFFRVYHDQKMNNYFLNVIVV